MLSISNIALAGVCAEPLRSGLRSLLLLVIGFGFLVAADVLCSFCLSTNFSLLCPIIAAAKDVYDAPLAAQLRIIKNGSLLDDAEKISKASDKAKSLLLKWSSDQALMKAPLSQSKAADLKILESNDHALRIYSWFTRNGGTLQANENVMQFRSSKNASHTQKLRPEPEYEGTFTSVETVHTLAGQTIYLLFGEMIGSNVDYQTSVRAYIKDGNALVKAKIFKSRTKLLDRINCDINRDISSDNDYPGIDFDKRNKIIKVPLINKDSTFDDTYLKYNFDGNRFVFRNIGR